MQLGACVLRGELPVNRGVLGIAVFFVDLKFVGERGDIGEAAIQTLAVYEAEFDLGHVQPTARLGRVVELQLLANPARFVGRERFVE